MIFELLILNGYGQFVWPAFIFTFASLYYLYMSTKREFQKQEKIFFNEFRDSQAIKIQVSKNKKRYKEVLSSRSI